MRDKTKDDNGLAGMPDGFNISESDIPGPDIKDIKGWTPQDYIDLQRIRLEEVKEKNNFHKWVWVTLIIGITTSVVNATWEAYQYNTSLGIEEALNDREHAKQQAASKREYAQTYTDKFFEIFKDKEFSDADYLRRTIRFAELLKHAVPDEALQDGYSKYHANLKADEQQLFGTKQAQKTDVEAEKVSLQTGIESLKSRGRLSKDKKEELAVMEKRLKSLHEEAKLLEEELKQAPTRVLLQEVPVNVTLRVIKFDTPRAKNPIPDEKWSPSAKDPLLMEVPKGEMSIDDLKVRRATLLQEPLCLYDNVNCVIESAPVRKRPAELQQASGSELPAARDGLEASTEPTEGEDT